MCFSRKAVSNTDLLFKKMRILFDIIMNLVPKCIQNSRQITKK